MKICKKPLCFKKASSRKMCYIHYSRWRRKHLDGKLGAEYPRKCIISGCPNKPESRRLCRHHYHQAKYYGNIDDYPKVTGFDTGIPT